MEGGGALELVVVLGVHLPEAAPCGWLMGCPQVRHASQQTALAPPLLHVTLNERVLAFSPSPQLEDRRRAWSLWSDQSLQGPVLYLRR
eukprot:CAMPEP_0196663326 /NCGR_PEP_ID=MMETSP1086-20130531/52422_1 /TAXON_ID=77921 /ORGANISM="Cyanoptyche  gloeocystis , Strain SAG4.97" /LENGTH=87 /DNA_ID=CAMNT_0041999091 /DNA_START=374 /DNA_END=635 /DNA_ORIENTATION=-